MSLSILRSAAALGVMACLGLSTPVFAAATSATLNVKLTIVAGCSVSADDTLDFGTWSGTAVNIDAQANIKVQCSAPAQKYSIALDGGAAKDINARKVKSGANLVGYQLYSNPERTAVWGVTKGTNTVSGTTVTAADAQTLTVYGRVPVQPAPAIGVYTDAVTVTISLD
jgi:spore coat protein U-like protein